MSLPDPPPRLLAFGLGYTASHLARRLLSGGWRVLGTHRPGSAPPAVVGAEILPFDASTPLPAEALSGVTHVLASIPPSEAGDPILLRHGAQLAALPSLRWIGYLSTTGVYGDTGGAEVDEDTPPAPTRPRSHRRVLAERAWLSLGADGRPPVHVFRLAGIYGPGRSALDRVRAGQARRLDVPGLLTSRIHVEDIAAVLEASMAAPCPGRIYNVADDHPAPPEAVIAHACRLLGLEIPPLIPLEEADLTPMAASFYQDRRRVSNRRIKEELGVRLRYPSYVEGLSQLL